MSASNFFGELRRRHVYRVAVAYLVTGWLLVQLASIVLPTFGAPAWVLKVVVGLLGLFFPVALILSWAFEMTPDGMRRTVPAEAEAARPEATGRRVGRTLDRAIIAVLAVAVALLGWRVFGPGHGGQPAPGRQGSSASAEGNAAPGAEPAAATASSRSIAVLPFESLSEDKSNAYFASGMQDMILTKLAGVGDLKVISRTSTEQYGSNPANLKTVAQQLGVAHLLEGSVQKAGNQVLINVQLIDARTDAHLWADSYTRTLDNVFGVEGEVAQKIAAALQAKLTPAEQRSIAAPPTTDAAAYDLYLQADAHFHRGFNHNLLAKQELPQAIRLYEQALARDPGFALAAAGLGMSHIILYWFGPDRTEARLAAAKAAADSALALQPDLGEGHYALGLYDYYAHRDYAAAVEQLERARRVLPNDPDVQGALAAILRRQAKWESSDSAFRQAALLDPRRSQWVEQLALSYGSLRRYAASDSAWTRAAALSQDPSEDLTGRGWTIVAWKGELAPYGAALETLTPGTDTYRANLANSFSFAWFSRDWNAAIRAASADSLNDWSDRGNVALPALLELAWAREASGDTAGAQAEYAAVASRMHAALAKRPDDPDRQLALGLAAAGLGRKDEAERAGGRAMSLMPVERDAVAGPGYIFWAARIFARVGDEDRAIQLLQRLSKMPAGLYVSPALLRLDPAWDPLRKDPAFQALAQEEAPERTAAAR